MGGRTGGKAMERIGFALAGLAAAGAAAEFARAGFGAECLAGLATAATFAFVGGLLRHGRRVAEFKRLYPGWSETGLIRRRQ
jgi:hypothetical protein